MYDLGPQFKINQEDLKVDPNCILVGEKYRIQVLTERLIRFEYSENGKFVDSASALVLKRNFQRPIFTVKEDAAYIYIETKLI